MHIQKGPADVPGRGVLQDAVFTVFDAAGAVLARESIAGPLAFDAAGSVVVRQHVAWTPPDTLGRSLNLRFVVAVSDGTTRVIDRTITF